MRVLALHIARVQEMKGDVRAHDGRKTSQQHKQQQPKTAQNSCKDKTKVHPKIGQGCIEAVMFVPHTPGGLLVKQLQEKEDMFSHMHKIGRVKMIERGGKRLKDILTIKIPGQVDLAAGQTA